MSDLRLGMAKMKAEGAPVTKAAYPEGPEGIPISVDTVAAKMREGAHDKDVRGWAVDVLKAAKLDGRDLSVTNKDRAQAILDELRRSTVYVEDPYNTEWIQSAATTLCLRPGLCIRGGDCDDLTVVFGAALLSIGIPVRAVKQFFGEDKQQHILVAFQDDKGTWWYADCSTNHPITQYSMAKTEEWVNPMDPSSKASQGTGASIITLGRALHAATSLSRELWYIRGTYYERTKEGLFRWYPSGPVHPEGMWKPIAIDRKALGVGSAWAVHDPGGVVDWLTPGECASQTGLGDSGPAPIPYQALTAPYQLKKGLRYRAGVMLTFATDPTNNPRIADETRALFDPLTGCPSGACLAIEELGAFGPLHQQVDGTYYQTWIVQGVATSDATLKDSARTTWMAVGVQSSTPTPDTSGAGAIAKTETPPPDSGATFGFVPTVLVAGGLAVVGGVAWHLYKAHKAAPQLRRKVA